MMKVIAVIAVDPLGLNAASVRRVFQNGYCSVQCEGLSVDVWAIDVVSISEEDQDAEVEAKV